MAAIYQILFKVSILVLTATLALSLPSNVQKRASPLLRIMGGEVVKNNDLNFIIHIFVNDLPTCGGALISKDWALTAAHCVTNINDVDNTYKVAKKDKLKVVYGTTDGAELDTNKVSVKNIFVHPSFDAANVRNDIAILELDTSNSIQTQRASPVPISSSKISPGQQLVVSGWGQTTNSDEKQSDVLNFANMIAAPIDQCKGQTQDFTDQNGPLICTSYESSNGKGTCNGDSGGPLVIKNNDKYELVGLVSYDLNSKNPNSDDCAVKGIFSFFTNVRMFIDFITKVTKLSASSIVAGDVSGFTQIAAKGNSSMNSNANKTTGSGDSDTLNTAPTMDDQEMQALASKFNPGYESTSQKAGGNGTSASAPHASSVNMINNDSNSAASLNPSKLPLIVSALVCIFITISGSP